MIEFWLAPIVVAQRMPELALEAQRLSLGQRRKPGRSESERMVTEKIAAIQQGAADLGQESLRTCFAIGMAAALGNMPHAANLMAGAPSRLARAALAPTGATLKANARRLRKRSPF